MTDQALEQAEKELVAATSKVRNLRRVPEKDDYPVDTVLRWVTTANNRYAALKKPGGMWSVTGRATGYELSWGSLRSIYFKIDLSSFAVATLWNDDLEDDPPQLKLDPHGYELTDVDSGVTWKREGDLWVKQ